MKITKIKRLAITGAIILDGTKDMKPVENKVILIEDDMIKAIINQEEWSGLSDKSSYGELNLHGQYIMPGLINMHVHLAGSGKPQKGQRDNEALVKLLMSTALSRAISYKVVQGFARTELMSGVTTIRTVGGLRDLDSRCRDDIKSGKVIGPRILAANEGISVPGGHMAGSVAVAVTSPDEAVKRVELAKKEGTDLIKLMITGGVLDATEKGAPGQVKMQADIIKAACDKAHSLGYKVAAHVESPEGVKLALKNGVDSIEHGAKPDEEMISLFKERGAILCTTISPALPFAVFDRSVSHATEVQQFNGNIVFEGIKECTKAALANDIPVALGNDVGCPYITQYDFWREPYYLAKYCDVSPSFALYSATLGNARLAGIGDITGSIEAGKKAELIVTTGNPLENLTALRKVNTVIAGGNLIEDPKIKHNLQVEAELDKYL